MRKRNSKKRLEGDQFALQKNAAEKGLKEAVDDVGAEGNCLQVVSCCFLRPGKHLLAGARLDPGAQLGYVEFVRYRDDAVKEELGCAARVTNGIREAMKFSAVPHQRAGFKLFQLERVVIQQAFRFRISRQQHLEAAVQSKAFDQVRAHSPTWPVAGLQQGHRDACSFE
jgi:hypothetical protein